MKTSDQRQPSLGFRPLTRDDLPLLHVWIGRPHVAEWRDAPTSLEAIAAIAAMARGAGWGRNRGRNPQVASRGHRNRPSTP